MTGEQTNGRALPEVGQTVDVRYERDFIYTLRVTIIAVSPPDEFTGRIEDILVPDVGVITGGRVLELKGREINFRKDDIVS
jgi:hypothetical protein